MPPSRRRRPRPAVSPTPRAVEPAPLPKRTGAKWRKGLEGWKNIWAVLGPAVALTGFAFLLWPQVKIDPLVNLNPKDALTAQFAIANSGKVPVYDLKFECMFGSRGDIHIGNMVTSDETLAPIPLLPPGKSRTRTCVVSSTGSEVPDLQITAHYKWPLIPKESEMRAYFRVARGVNGDVFLLPDERPIP